MKKKKPDVALSGAFKVSQAPYRGHLHVLFGVDAKYAERYRKKHKLEFTSDDDKEEGFSMIDPKKVEGVVYTMNLGDNLMWLATHNNKMDCGVLAHECLHAVQMICKHTGIGDHDDAWEASAYMLQYLFDKIGDQLHKRGVSTVIRRI